MTQIIFHSIVIVKIHRFTSAHHDGNEERIIKIIIAIISWTINIQTDIFQYNSSIDHLSLNNLMMIIVLLNAKAIEIYILVTISNHNHQAIKNQISVVKTTCPIQTTSDALPKSFTNAGLSHNQTINSSNATPK